MDKKHIAVASFELKGLSEDGTFEGYGSVFGVRDSFGAIVEKGAFKRSLKEDPTPALLWQHNTDEPIGVYQEIREDNTGLFVKGKFTRGVPKADAAHLLLRERALNGLSIGFRVNPGGAEFDEETGERTLTDVKLFEVSLVTFPANESALITDVRAALNEIETEREFERHLRDGGMSNVFAKLVARHGFEGAKARLNGRQRDAEFVGALGTLNESLSQMKGELRL